MDDAFVQFYTYAQDIIPGKVEDKYRWTNWNVISNGFSFVWDEATPIWVEIVPRRFTELPVKAKRIYVSTWYPRHMNIVVSWAQENPDCQFIIGGPISQIWHSLKCDLPKNITPMWGVAEQIFHKKPDPKTWKLIPPPAKVGTMYSYFLGGECYWKKCKFCDTNFGNERAISLEPLANAPPGFVWFSTPALNPAKYNLLSQLPYNGRRTYYVMIRSGGVELENLKRILPTIPDPTQLVFAVGIEFPSDQVLRFMNKGVTVKEQLEVINLITSYGHNLMLFYIVDWPNLTREDVDSAKLFFNSFSASANKLTMHRYGALVIYENSSFPIEWKQFRYEDSLFFYGYGPILNKEQCTLNDEFISLLDRFEFVAERTKARRIKKRQNGK